MCFPNIVRIGNGWTLVLHVMLSCRNSEWRRQRVKPSKIRGKREDPQLGTVTAFLCIVERMIEPTGAD